MTSLLRTTAIAAVLAFAAPYPALAGGDKVQDRLDTSAQTEPQTLESTAAPDTSVDITADATAAGDVDLMADFERLRMLDQIGEVQVVKLQPGEMPESGAAADSASTDIGSQADDMTNAEPGGTAADTTTSAGTDSEQVEERVDQAFEASGQPQAGATFEATEEPDAGATTTPSAGTSAETMATAEADASGEISDSFIEDTVEQMPEISAALEANDAEPADIVALDIEENGDVTIYVR
jgi:hypothetical protein